MFHVYHTTFDILIEMFDLFEIEFIYSLIILVCLNDPIGWVRIITISIFQIILTYYNNKWRHRLIIRIDVLDYNDPFPITRLYNFNFPTLIVRYYNKGGYDLAYEKAYLVEVSDVGLYNIIFGNYILKKSKSNFNDLWVFVLDLLVIV